MYCKLGIEYIFVEFIDVDGCIGWGEIVVLSDFYFGVEIIIMVWEIVMWYFVLVLLGVEGNEFGDLEIVWGRICGYEFVKVGFLGVVWDLFFCIEGIVFVVVLGGICSEVVVGVLLGIEFLIDELLM